MEPDIIRAIPREAVLKQLLLCIFAAAILVASKDFFLFHLTKYLSVTERDEALFRFRVVMAAFGVLLSPLIVYFGAQAYRIASSRQFPPPGTKVWRDTRIVRGHLALVRAGVVVLGACSLLGAAIFAQFIPQLAASYQSQPPHFCSRVELAQSCTFVQPPSLNVSA